MPTRTAFEHALLQQIFQAADKLNVRLALVGGAVRAALMDCPLPHDLDFIVLDGQALLLATSLANELYTRMALNKRPKAVVLDADWGIVRLVVWLPGQEASFTVDLANALNNDLLSDLNRRDVTVNAIAWDGQQLIDPLNGQMDLRRQIIRQVASNNLKEDPLRVLRVFRTASVFEHATIEPETLTSCSKYAPLLQEVAKERILTEWLKLLSSKPQCLLPLLSQMTPLLHYFTTMPPELAIEGVQKLQQACHDLHLDAPLDASLNGYAYHAWLRWLALGADRVDTLAHYPLSREAHRLCTGWLQTATVLTQPLPEALIDQCALWRNHIETVPGALALLYPRVLDRQAAEAILIGWQAYQFKQANNLRLVTGLTVTEEWGINKGPAVQRILDATWDAQIAGAVTTLDQAHQWIKRHKAELDLVDVVA